MQLGEYKIISDPFTELDIASITVEQEPLGINYFLRIEKTA
jgi:hypothetical protein